MCTSSSRERSRSAWGPHRARSLLVLTKVAPGVVGVWFVVRRQWRATLWGATLRLAAALGIVIWAARTGRAWLLAPALILACPVLGGYGPLAVLAAIPRLLEFERAERAAKTPDRAAKVPDAGTSGEKHPLHGHVSA